MYTENVSIFAANYNSKFQKKKSHIFKFLKIDNFLHMWEKTLKPVSALLSVDNSSKITFSNSDRGVCGIYKYMRSAN